jgi:hypothetical protein
MRNRCLNEQEPAWQRYGGRGITIVAAWDDFKVFQADMGEAPEGLTLERIDNDGPYAPWNCRWETDAQQTRNKRSNVWLTYNSKTQVVADWARETGIQRQTILWRISAGWDVERTLTQLPRTPKQRRRHVVSAL